MEGEGLRQTAQFEAAREAYQKAIEVNPANFYAHQELGDLYFQRFNDPGMALYHYHRYLEIGQRVNGRTFTDPTAESGIQGCELKLAERVAGQIARQRPAVEFEQLKRDNDVLRQQLAELQRQLQLRALENRNPPPATNAVPTNRVSVPTPVPNNLRTPAPTNRVTPRIKPNFSPTREATSNPTREAPRPAPRTYVVHAGDTPATIARAQGVRLPDLLAANPGLEPRRMKVGQVIKLPPK